MVSRRERVLRAVMAFPFVALAWAYHAAIYACKWAWDTAWTRVAEEVAAIRWFVHKWVYWPPPYAVNLDDFVHSAQPGELVLMRRKSVFALTHDWLLHVPYTAVGVVTRNPNTRHICIAELSEHSETDALTHKYKDGVNIVSFEDRVRATDPSEYWIIWRRLHRPNENFTECNNKIWAYVRAHPHGLPPSDSDSTIHKNNERFSAWAGGEHELPKNTTSGGEIAYQILVDAGICETIPRGSSWTSQARHFSAHYHSLHLRSGYEYGPEIHVQINS